MVIATQLKAKQPLPVLSQYGAALSLPDAYHVQRRALQEVLGPESPAGFRAALTRPRGQVQYNVREPVTGVVLKSGIKKGEAAFNLRQYKHLMAAPGLAYVIKTKLNRKVHDLRELESALSTALPIIDFADPHFEPGIKVHGSDFIANNLAFTAVMVGKPLASTATETLNGLSYEMLRNGEVIDRGHAMSVMGSQMTALFWLVNQLIQQGWRLEPGMLLITGGFSDPVTLKPGDYTVRFWEAANFEFSVR